MSLHLVTGPANSAKAQIVLDRFCAAIAQDPILVVPTAADAELYRRELAGRGIVFGVRVERFGGLFAEIATRAGIDVSPLGTHARICVIAAAIESCKLDLLADSAGTPGFVHALAQLIAQLRRSRATPQRLHRALRTWSAADGPSVAWSEEVASLYGAYCDALAKLGAVDQEQRTWQALDALRLEPPRWGTTPVFIYGFDDLDRLQRDAIRTLTEVVGVNVTLALPYEAGRVAFAGRATTFEELRPESAEQIQTLSARDDYYEGSGRHALHQLERAIFEERGEQRVVVGPELRLLAANSQRDEYERGADAIAAAIAAGITPHDIAVVGRFSAADGELLEEVLSAAGVPVAPFRPTRLRDTPVGRGLLALIRAALLDGSSDDLVAYLRTPGFLDAPLLADELEARARRSGVRTAAQARLLWEERYFPLEVLDRFERARERGPLALIQTCSDALERIFAAPFKRSAPLFDARERAHANCVNAARTALAQLRKLALADPRLAAAPQRLHDILAVLEVEPEHDPLAGVVVCDPLRLRARRMRMVVLCGLQAGTFPRPQLGDPFFSADDVAALARASGLLLDAPLGDALSAERYLFYAVISRPTARLVLSWREAGDDGEDEQRSLFVDDVLDVVDVAIEVGAPHKRDPSEGLAPVSLAPLAPDTLRARALSPSSLERWSDCPAAWLIEREIRAQDLQPDAEPLARGSLAHDVLERVFSELASIHGSARISDEEQLQRAQELLLRIFAQQAPATPISTNPVRQRIEAYRLRADLARYLERAAHWGSTYEPRAFELSFGLGDERYPAVTLAQGELTLRGRIDRVDVDPGGGQAVIHDYKSADAPAAARWLRERRFQVALYMLAAEQLLEVDVVGGFYQALRGAPDTRGVIVADVDPDLDCVANDRRSPEELALLLRAAQEIALTAARELRAGALVARPRTCSPQQGCRYPTLCRLGGT